MASSPFNIFTPYQQHIRVSVACKTDAASTPAHAIRLNQVHGNRTVVLHNSTDVPEPADGAVTNTPGLTLSVRWADCQNFVVYAPNAHVAGVLHAGWRGLHCGAIAEFFRVLQETYAVPASEVIVGAGPSLCASCAEFSNPRTELPNIAEQYIQGRCVDLQQAATDQFVALGVPPDAIERSADCTKCQPKTYWTYRGGDKQQVLSGQSNILLCTLIESKIK